MTDTYGPGSTDEAVPYKPSLADLVDAWECRKRDTEAAAKTLEIAKAVHARAAEDQKAAYKAMNEAIDAVRPKRPKKAITTQDGTKIAAEGQSNG